MMPDNGFPPTSRYASIPLATLRSDDGREIVYLTRRFVPPAESLAQVREHFVKAAERLDNITAEHIGDPEQFWQVCDANTAFEPAMLVEEPGKQLRITLPQGVPGASHI